MNTSSSMSRPSQICTPDFTVTRSPICTSPSTRTCAQMLHCAPMRAPARITANCQTRVSGPMSHGATSANECTWADSLIGIDCTVVTKYTEDAAEQDVVSEMDNDSEHPTAGRQHGKVLCEDENLLVKDLPSRPDTHRVRRVRAVKQQRTADRDEPRPRRGPDHEIPILFLELLVEPTKGVIERPSEEHGASRHVLAEHDAADHPPLEGAGRERRT